MESAAARVSAPPRGSILRLLRQHWAFALVLAVAALLRMAISFAYAPALLYSDSWGYLSLAFSRTPANIGPFQPSGYPLLIRLITLPSRRLELVTAAQHLAGLMIGVLLYLLLLRLGTRRWLATLATAVVLLDAYVITLEQYVMAETFFTLLVVAGLFLTLAVRKSARVLAAAGGCLGLAATLRVVGLIVVVVWIAYVLSLRSSRRVWVPAFAGVALPLLAYMSIHAVVHAGFAMTSGDGWILYGRVGAIADCKGGVPQGTRQLCVGDPSSRPRSPAWYIFSESSPARRAFPRGVTRRNNRLLREFAVATIEHHPGTFANLVLRDFLRYFYPEGGGVGGRHPGAGTPVNPLVLPDENSPEWETSQTERVHRAYLPSYRGRTIRWPAKTLRAYSNVLHTQRWLVALLALLALTELLATLLSPGAELPRQRQVSLLAFAALFLMLTPTVIDYFQLRFLMPALVLLVAGGAMAMEDLAASVRDLRAQKGASAATA